jgi:D-glycero-D-manno-heptose 1,7-bisphosphate phosphatase
MRRLAGCGYLLVVASNQRGIARGLLTDDVLRATERALQEALAPHGVRIAGFYYCPHEIAEECDCRKPKPGLLLRAAEELGVDLGASWMVGDSPADIEAGESAGCSTAYLGQGPGVSADLTAESLEEAAALICERP